MPFASLSPVTQALVAFLAVLLPTLLFTPDPGSSTAAIQSVLLQFFLVALIPVILAHLLNRDEQTVLKLRSVGARNLLWCLLLAFSAVFLLDEIVFWQERLTGAQANLSPDIQKLLHADSPLQLVWRLFALALVPAICEELLFRGFIFGRFLQTGQPGQSLMMTSLLFGLFHRNLAALLPTTLAGIFLAFAVWRTGSVYCAMAMHALINTWAILVVNTRLEEFLAWTRQSSHVPAALLFLGVAGVVVAGKQLRPEHVAGARERDSC